MLFASMVVQSPYKNRVDVRSVYDTIGLLSCDLSDFVYGIVCFSYPVSLSLFLLSSH